MKAQQIADFDASSGADEEEREQRVHCFDRDCNGDHPYCNATDDDAPDPACNDCGTVADERSPCPGCGRRFCQSCAEKPYAFCCDGEGNDV